MLCERCQNFNIQVFHEARHAHVGYRLVDIVSSALSGCSFCGMICDCLISRNIKTFRNDKIGWVLRTQLYIGSRSPLSTRLHKLAIALFGQLFHLPWIGFHFYTGGTQDIRTEGGLNIRLFRVSFQEGGKSTNDISLEAAADPGTQAALSHDIVGSITNGSHESWNPTVMETIKSWHDNCVSNHPSCSKTLGSRDHIDVEHAPLPKRCLEIRKSSVNNSPDSVEVILRETAGQRGKYISLSHRWNASTAATKTTTDNYASRKQAFQLNGEYEQACSLALQLGVSLIWIDSICIIQSGEEEDWKDEATKMADYYQYSWLTLFLTSPTGESFALGGASDCSPMLIRLPYRGKDGKQQGYFYVQNTDDAWNKQTRYTRQVEHSELLRRGWVCQEWYLSRRRLILSPAGLYLECTMPVPRTVSGAPMESGQDLHLGRDMKDALSASLAWEKVSRHYSRLGFTYIEKDRLVALSGLAKEFSSVMQESSRYQYVAGTWLCDVDALLWMQLVAGTQHRIRGIPTWSWASMATCSGDQAGDGMPVDWIWIWGKQRDAEIQDVVAVRVDSDLRPRYDEGTRFTPNSEYGDDHRFAILGLIGRLLRVEIRGSFVTTDEVLIAAKATGIEATEGRDLWQRVTCCSSPDKIRGWASLEHPSFQSGEEQRLLALVVSTSVGKGGLALGNWLYNTIPAYIVLFLRSTTVPGHSPAYERVGIGGLFGYEFEKEYQQEEERKIWMV